MIPLVVYLSVFALLNVAQAADKEVYFAVGEPLVLEPGSVVGPITSITWKSQGDIVTEWMEDVIPLADFGDFKGRTALDLKTGILTIKISKPADAGKFTVEINNRVQADGYNAVILQKVPEPVVVLRPLTCKETSEKCSLSCDGDAERPELVSYFWRKDLGEWEKSGKDMEIINDEKTQDVETFFCKIQNPVSEKESELLKNPFFKPPPPTPIRLIVGIIFGILVVAGGGIFAFIKREQIPKWVSSIRGGASNAEASTANGNKPSGENEALHSEAQAFEKTI